MRNRVQFPENRAAIDELYARRGGGGGGKSGTQYAFVYQPQGPASFENVYTDWPSLNAALQLVQGPKLIWVDDTYQSPAVVPAGSYNLSGCTFMGVPRATTTSGGAALQFAAGVRIQSPAALVFQQLDVSYLDTTTPCITVGAGQEVNCDFIESANIVTASSAAPFVKTATATSHAYAQLRTAVVGDSTHAVFVDAGLGGDFFVLAIAGCDLKANAVSGSGLTVDYDDTSLPNAPQGTTNLTPLWRTSTISVLNFGAVGNGTHDDTTNLQNALNAMAGTGVRLYFPGGYTFLVSSALTVPSSTMILGSEGCTIKSTITPSGGPGGFTNSVFFATRTNVGAAVAVTGAPTIGGRTIPVGANAIANGSTIVLQSADGFTAQSLTVTAGGGTATLTVDDAIEYHFTNTSTVVPCTLPSDIFIDGQGMVISGTGDRAVELAFAQRCTVKNIRNTPTFGSFVSLTFSFDTAGRDNLFDRLWCDGGASSLSAYALESNNRSKCTNSYARNTQQTAGGYGAVMLTCVNCSFQGLTQTLSYDGIGLVSASINDVDSTIRCSVVDCVAENNASDGFIFGGGSDDQITNCRSNNNTQSGYDFGPSAFGNPTLRYSLSNCGANNNTLYGLFGNIAGASVQVANLETQGNGAGAAGAFGIYVDTTGTFTVDGWVSTNDARPWQTAAACTLRLNHCYVRTDGTVAGLWSGQLYAAAQVVLDDYVAEVTGGSTAVTTAIVDMNTAGSTIRLDNVRTVGAFSLGVNSTSGVATQTLRGGDNDLTSATTAWSLDGSALANFGSFTLNGVNQVNVAGFFVPDSAIAWSLKSVGSTTSTTTPYFSAATTSGAFHVKSVTALCNDVYNWHAY